MSHDIRNNHRQSRKHRKNGGYKPALHGRKCKMSQKAMLSERAAKALAGQKRNKHENIEAYLCKACARWHIGHNQDESRLSRWYKDIGRITIRRFKEED